MAKVPTHGLAKLTSYERVMDEIQKRGWSIRRFTNILDARYPRLLGTSRPTVTKILTGHATPSLEWVQAAASIFGVMPRWLREGTGPRQLEDYSRHSASKADILRPVKTLDQFRLRVDEAFMDLDYLPDTAFFGITGYLGVLYRQKGPRAFDAEAPENWRWPESGDELGGEPGVTTKQITTYIWQEFGRVLRWSGTGDAERIAATLAILSSLYLTEFAGHF